MSRLMLKDGEKSVDIQFDGPIKADKLISIFKEVNKTFFLGKLVDHQQVSIDTKHASMLDIKASIARAQKQMLNIDPDGDKIPVSPHDFSPEALQASRDMFTIRERLPNSNVVDLSTLDIKKAVTESALVRCPHCGQSHALIIKDNGFLYLLRHRYSDDTFIVVKEVPVDSLDELNNLCYHGTDAIDKDAYFLELQGYPALDAEDFAVNNNTELFCPVCKRSATFLDWKRAYERKHDFFEYDYICPACGGECMMDAQSERDGVDMVVCTACGRKWAKDQT